MLCVVVSTAQSGMALRSFRRAGAPCEPQRFSTIDRIPSTLGGCVERMNVWRACGWRGTVEVVCFARLEPNRERQRCGPFTHPLAHQRVPLRYARVSHAARPHPGTPTVLQTLRPGCSCTTGTGRHVLYGVSDTAWPDAVHGLVLPISRGLRSRSLWNGSHCDDDEQRRVW
jgi:hypothetical protein